MAVLKAAKTSVGRVRRGMSGLMQALKLNRLPNNETDVPFANVRAKSVTSTNIEEGREAWSASEENGRVIFGPVVFARSYPPLIREPFICDVGSAPSRPQKRDHVLDAISWLS